MSQPEYYLVIDFESTCCDKGSIKKQHMEIIEFGVTMVRAADFSIIDEFQSFVRPKLNPTLTNFCKNLTSISQNQIDNAPHFTEVVKSFKKWLYDYQNFVFCSWGDYDFHQLNQDCIHHNIPNPISAPHFNVKKIFSSTQGLTKKMGLGQAIDLARIQFQGIHHRGIDDARNISRLLPYIFGTAKINQ